MLASITIWNSGSINRELIQSSAQESVHLVICMILKTPSVVLCVRWREIHFRATSCDIRATSCELFSLFLQWLKFVTLASVWKIKSTNTGISVLFIYFYVYFVFVMYIFVYFMLYVHVNLFGMWVCRLYVRCVLLLRERDRARYLN